MNIKFLTIALCAAFAAFTFNAQAQKVYTQGAATFTLSSSAGSIDAKVYFTPDSNALVMQQGPANIKILGNSKDTYAAILVDVPVASMKKVAVLTPDEIDQIIAAAPKFTFTPSTETKQINGFNCKKVTVKDPKSGTTYTAWVTSDISAPLTGLTKLYAGAGGVPVQFTTFQQGKVVEAALKSITDEKPPQGTFSIAGFDRITMDELNSLGGKR